MDQNLTIAKAMLPRINSQTLSNLLSGPDLTLSADGPVRVVYAPFDYIETRAKLVVVGITPGMTQAVNALNAASASLEKGATLEECLAVAKLTASFSGGAIRNNLVAMLDTIGVAKHFGVPSTDVMFRPGATDVHFTSALRYPVFVNGKNYNGTPDMVQTGILRSQLDTHLTEEARALSRAIWLPLGPKANTALTYLVRQGRLDPRRVLAGMPHPSGANAERVAVFLGRKRPEAASSRTNSAALLKALARLRQQIADLEGALA
ncbi:hypothetical protein [uncultured Marivita sp.]|uniref:hypothetical protein n=1 Tax=uncultured Marivita sp. TaxID=888080 RepID=UPI0026112C46|nr:hypothetical protein [uncultured Marivita sp.]